MYFLIYYFSLINLEITHATSDTEDILENESEPEPEPKVTTPKSNYKKKKGENF